VRVFWIWIFKVLPAAVLLGAVPERMWAQSSSNAGPGSVIAAGEGGTPPTFVRDVLPIVLGRCYSCHNDQTKFLRDWSDYSTAFSHRVEIKRRVWDSWQGRYYKEPMPAGNSPQCIAMTEADRATIKRWVEQGAARGTLPVGAPATSRTERIEAGRKLFGTVCLPCHQANGQGVPDRFPPLAASDFLNADRNRAIATLLNGRQGEMVVNGRKFNSSMPRLPFDDAQIANVLTYVYASFGNSGQNILPQDVSRVRSQKVAAAPAPKTVKTAEQSSPWE